MADRFPWSDGPKPAQGHRPPRAVDALPVHRGLPLLAAAWFQPSDSQTRAGIAAILHEGEELAVGDRPRPDLESIKIDPVARSFIVEGKSGPVVADPFEVRRRRARHPIGGTTTSTTARHPRGRPDVAGSAPGRA